MLILNIYPPENTRTDKWIILLPGIHILDGYILFLRFTLFLIHSTGTALHGVESISPVPIIHLHRTAPIKYQ